MIFLKKLFHRPVGSKKKGSITVWLTLSFLVFLGLYLICLQSVQKQSAKRRAEQAVENGMFSLFSEYEPHLLRAEQRKEKSFAVICGNLYRRILRMSGENRWMA